MSNNTLSIGKLETIDTAYVRNRLAIEPASTDPSTSFQLSSEYVWQLYGQVLTSDTSDVEYGFSNAISADGNIIAIGAPLKDGKGQVKVFEYTTESGWVYRYAELLERSVDDQFGYSVSLSQDGKYLAVGSIQYDTSTNTSTGNGYVRIYERNIYSTVPLTSFTSDPEFVVSSSTYVYEESWKAFTLSPSNFWHTAELYNGTTGAYTGTYTTYTTEGTKMLGEFLQVHTKTPTNYRRFYMYPRQNTDLLAYRTPREVNVIGCNESLPYLNGLSSSFRFLFNNNLQMNMATNGGFSAFCRVRFKSPSSSYTRVFDFGYNDGSVPSQLLITRDGATNTLWFSVRTSTFSANTNYAVSNCIENDVWIDIKWTYDVANTELKIYKNGVVVFTTNETETINSNPIFTHNYIARTNEGYGDPPSNIDIAGVVVYDKPITDPAEQDLIMDCIKQNRPATDLPQPTFAKVKCIPSQLVIGSDQRITSWDIFTPQTTGAPATSTQPKAETDIPVQYSEHDGDNVGYENTNLALNIKTNGGFTICTRFRFTGTVSYQRIFEFGFSELDTQGNKQIMMYRFSTTSTLTIQINSPTFTTETPGFVIDVPNFIVNNEWTNLAIVYTDDTNSTLSVYRDGLLFFTTTLVGVSISNDVVYVKNYLGRRRNTISTPDDTLIDIQGFVFHDTILPESDFDQVFDCIRYHRSETDLPYYPYAKVKCIPSKFARFANYTGQLIDEWDIFTQTNSSLRPTCREETVAWEHIQSFSNLVNWTLEGRSLSFTNNTSMYQYHRLVIPAVGNIPDPPAFLTDSVQFSGYFDNTWVQQGTDLVGNVLGEKFGHSVSLSEDGSMVAIGSPYSSGVVRVYQWGGSDWVQKGADLNGTNQYGYAVSLSSDGTVLAVGSVVENAVRVFTWNVGTSSWDIRGSVLFGTTSSQFGHVVSLSADGNVLAVGAPTDVGYVRVFDWKSLTGTWVQKGSDLLGETTGDQMGHSLVLSDDGHKLAVSVIGSDTDKGKVVVYEWNPNVRTWVLIGEVVGDSSLDAFGQAVSLSGDGTRVLGSSSETEYVKVYQSDKRLSISKGTETFIQNIDHPVSGNSLSFRTNDVTRMILSSSGNVGIGTTSPSEKLHVIGNTEIDVSLSTIGSGGDMKNGLHFKHPAINNQATEYYYGITGSGVNIDNQPELTTTQVGLMFKGTGFYGTEMLFYTTDNYAEGAKRRMTIATNGNVGIGTNSPAHKLHLYDGVNFNGIMVQGYNNNAYSAGASTQLTVDGMNLIGQSNGGTVFMYWRNTNVKYQYYASASSQIFTGQHKSFSSQLTPKLVTSNTGLIVVSTGRTKTYVSKLSNNMVLRRNDVNNAHPEIELSSKPYQKSVYGVISNYDDDKPDIREGVLCVDDDEKKENGFYDDLCGRLRVNSLGEGSVWVTDENGVIENGDYIVSSSLAGYGMKQNDDLLHNYTVAKVTVDCDFIRRTIRRQKIKHTITYDETHAKTIHITYDENGITQFEDAYISDIRPLEEDEKDDFIEETEYDMRWFYKGEHITEDTYQTLYADENNHPDLRIACFLPCTYHCG